MRPAGEDETRGAEVPSEDQTKAEDMQPSIDTTLTIAEVAEKLGIPVEAACALVAASLRNVRQAESRPNPL